MSFKESVAADCKSVFLNTDEFADLHTVKYDGEIYRDIPVVLTKVKERERTVVGGDHMQGVHLVSATAHMALEDLGCIPEQKRHIEIDDGSALGVPFYRKFRIVTSDCEMGIVVLELEAFDE